MNWSPIFAVIALLLPLPVKAAAVCGASAHGGKLSELELNDLDGRLSELETRLRKGLSVTILSDVEAADRRFTFGCRIFYDLWDEMYLVLPIVGAVEVKEQMTTVKKLDHVPDKCTRVTLPWSLRRGTLLEVRTQLNPISEEQAAKTRKWLAERGIGANGALAGRAVYAMVDLKQTQSFQRRCPVQ